MAKLELIATATFGLEAVVKREIGQLGYKILRSEDAKITFLGDERAIVRANLWLRSADRVLVKLGEFQAQSFEELFQQTKALAWEQWIPEDGKFVVTGTSVKSKLHSVPDCQSIVKKAIVEKLKETYLCDWFAETGALYTVKATLLKDRVTITLDTSGAGLHKRGYRVKTVDAPIKETLAAALVQLSFWKEGRLLCDPFCGSGTIPIEAAMIAANIAPGLSRRFAAEAWEAIPKEIWKEERSAAFRAMKSDADIRIEASDISRLAVAAAKANAEEAGVDEYIRLRVAPVSALEKIHQTSMAADSTAAADGTPAAGGTAADGIPLPAAEPYGIIIANPPYGERIGEKEAIRGIYADLRRFLDQNPTWSLYLITSDKEFEKQFRPAPADRRRKLYNGRIETCFYQYFGEKPPKQAREEQTERSGKPQGGGRS